MSDVVKSHDDIRYLLDFLFKKREELISPFLNKDAEWISKTFKYERNQAAFNLVRECFVTLWIDGHIVQIANDDFPDHLRKKTTELLSGMATTFQGLEDIKTIHCLLERKHQIQKYLLKYDDYKTKSFNELKYSYDMDKALFERKFEKYESKIKKRRRG